MQKKFTQRLFIFIVIGIISMVGIIFALQTYVGLNTDTLYQHRFQHPSPVH